jgi:hypothetical protein
LSFWPVCCLTIIIKAQLLTAHGFLKPQLKFLLEASCSVTLPAPLKSFTKSINSPFFNKLNNNKMKTLTKISALVVFAIGTSSVVKAQTTPAAPNQSIVLSIGAESGFSAGISKMPISGALADRYKPTSRSAQICTSLPTQDT